VTVVVDAGEVGGPVIAKLRAALDVVDLERSPVAAAELAVPPRPTSLDARGRLDPWTGLGEREL